MAITLVFLSACLVVAHCQLQQLNPLEHYLDQEQAAYYRPQQQKLSQDGGSSRLENLEPDSEVELLPGAQQPQQPPQQNPLVPTIPGLLPGQRVFIVNMPVPGYNPGTVGGYQPVYVVAADPQGVAGYPGNGYQNGVLRGLVGQGGVPLYPGGANPFQYRPYDQLYPQDPNYLAYQPAQAGQLLVVPVAQTLAAKHVGQLNANPTNGQIRSEVKNSEEDRQQARPAPQHRNKA